MMTDENETTYDEAVEGNDKDEHNDKLMMDENIYIVHD